MKPLSGFWVYLNLVTAIAWDFLGLILFFIDLIPAVQVVSIVGSFLVDFSAITTDIIFTTIYYTYLGTYFLGLKSYQIQTVASLVKLSKRSQGSTPQANRLQQTLSRNAQEAGKNLTKKFFEYIESVGWKRIVGAIIAFVIELIPLLGDFLPTWTVRAWVQVAAHNTRARKLRDDNQKFEDAMNKWRRSLTLGGMTRNVVGRVSPKQAPGENK